VISFQLIETFLVMIAAVEATIAARAQVTSAEELQTRSSLKAIIMMVLA
jgi:hypothetical protein